jgi:hypothetical protein
MDSTMVAFANELVNPVLAGGVPESLLPVLSGATTSSLRIRTLAKSAFAFFNSRISTGICAFSFR